MIGIYKLTCTPTDRSYIGSSVLIADDPFFYRHPLAAELHPNQPLQDDFIAFGVGAFQADILYRFNTNKVNSKMLFDAEIYFKEQEKPSYNAEVNRKVIVVDGYSVPSYAPSDYEGRFNLKLLEKDLIIKAAVKTANRRNLMAEKLGISDRALYRKLINHNLQIVV